MFLSFNFQHILPLNTFAESPSFVRQQIEDNRQDFLSLNYTLQFGPPDRNCMEISTPIDIKSVSYVSNGTALVATIWLNSPPATNSRDYDSPKNMTAEELAYTEHIVYSMYVDVNSVYESGTDYIMNVYRNNTGNIWEQEFLETSSPNAKFLESKLNSFEIEDQYVTMSLDLATINHPENFNLFFYTGFRPDLNYRSEIGCDSDLIDTAGFVIVPPPEFQISSSPNPLELRPGEEKNVQLRIKSEANIDSYASISTKKTEDDIQTNLSSDLISILPFGNGITTIKVMALGDATVGSYELPLLLNVSSQKVLEATDPTGFQLGDYTSTGIPKNFILTVNVLPGPGPKEHLDNFAAFISPLNSVWTFLAAIGAVIVPLIIRRKQKDQKEKEQKKDDG